jgi:GNAT superfamily N-acetyltransferase
MITILAESFEERLPELKPILPLHYEELALDQDKVPLAPNYDVYIERERHGQVMFMVARDKGELIGYFIGFVMPGLHYMTCLTLAMDIFYIHPAHRGNNTGRDLFKAVEAEAKRRGVQRMIVSSKVHFSADWLFNRLGYTEIEHVYSNWIGD